MLRLEVLRKGNGTIAPRGTTTVEYMFHGQLLVDYAAGRTVAFDSTYARSAPTAARPQDLRPGLAEALTRMVEGEKWRVWIPSELAYGARGGGKAIPPNQALVYVIEVLHVRDAADITRGKMKHFATPVEYSEL